jgi:hypothetical protein
MIGVVNADSKLLADYKQNATKVSRAVTPREVFGGLITTADASKDDSSSGDKGGDNKGAAGTTRATLGSAAFGFALALLVARI